MSDEFDDSAFDPEPLRVGRHFPIHVYRGDVPVATFHGALEAARAVRAVNAYRKSQALVRHLLDLCDGAESMPDQLPMISTGSIRELIKNTLGGTP